MEKIGTGSVALKLPLCGRSSLRSKVSVLFFFLPARQRLSLYESTPFPAPPVYVELEGRLRIRERSNRGSTHQYTTGLGRVINRVTLCLKQQP